ncbi:hypothetical protein K1719_036712 [Acacia pycnantha]|nr:hypothetical protein K1719_042502 [Acacia pycnantha]KAI9081371.1 hypothetical protein K1719_036712 [Acacia pycnantha]
MKPFLLIDDELSFVSKRISFFWAKKEKEGTQTHSILKTKRREEEIDGEGEDRDKEDREQNEQTGDILQKKEWAFEESL